MGKLLPPAWSCVMSNQRAQRFDVVGAVAGGGLGNECEHETAVAREDDGADHIPPNALALFRLSLPALLCRAISPFRGRILR